MIRLVRRSLCAATLALAIALTWQAQAAPKEARVAIYMLSLGKLDLDRASVPADFYLTFECAAGCPAIDFEIMNGRVTSTAKIEDTPTRKMFRLFAELRPSVDLRRFPFDTQTINVIIEDKNLEKDELTLVPDMAKTGFDDDIALPGWTLAGWSARATENDYAILGETYSRYVFAIDVAKPLWNAFLKSLMPVVFILLVVTCSYIIHVEKTDSRLGTATASLIGAVMFHVAITNQNPPLGYLTVADKFMLALYAFLFPTIAYNFAIYELVQHKREEQARRIHGAVRYKVIIGVPLVFAGVLGLIVWTS